MSGYPESTVQSNLAIWKSKKKPRYMEGCSISRLGILHCFGPRYMQIHSKTSLYGRVFDLPIGHFTLFWPSLYGNPFQNLAIWNKCLIHEAFHIARFDCIEASY